MGLLPMMWCCCIVWNNSWWSELAPLRVFRVNQPSKSRPDLRRRRRRTSRPPLVVGFPISKIHKRRRREFSSPFSSGSWTRGGWLSVEIWDDERATYFLLGWCGGARRKRHGKHTMLSLMKSTSSGAADGWIAFASCLRLHLFRIKRPRIQLFPHCYFRPVEWSTIEKEG